MFIVFSLVFTSCLKKIDLDNELGANIFDKEYTGEQWFEIEKAVQITTDLGEIKTKISARISAKFIPNLRPQFINTTIKNNGILLGETAFSVESSGGDYVTTFLVDYLGKGEYCMELAIIDEDSGESINPFVGCATLF